MVLLLLKSQQPGTLRLPRAGANPRLIVSGPLILHHTLCGHDFAPVIACDHCHAPLDPHDVR
jgi:hypothetical protein